MKKVLSFCLIFMGCFLITGCSNPITGSKSDNKYTRYEWHYYDKDFNHTEELIVKYDKKGDLYEYEESLLYDKVTDKKSCDNFNYRFKDVEGATETCKTTDEGTRVTRTFNRKYIDKRIAQKGEGSEDRKLLKEEYAKEYFEEGLKKLKEEVEHSDKYNYMVIANKKIEW